MIAYHTGMRLGEVLGLAWDCVDMDTETISVKRQLIYTVETGHAFGPPKTSSSVRSIPIGAELLATLKKWKVQQTANEVKHGRAYLYTYEDKSNRVWQMQKQEAPKKGMIRRALICTHENGKIITHGPFMQALRNHGINAHSLRHTHATICAENGAPSKGLAGRLGHSNTAITENLYTHETMRMQEKTLEAFEREKKKSVL